MERGFCRGGGGSGNNVVLRTSSSSSNRCRAETSFAADAEETAGRRERSNINGASRSLLCPQASVNSASSAGTTTTALSCGGADGGERSPAAVSSSSAQTPAMGSLKEEAEKDPTAPLMAKRTNSNSLNDPRSLRRNTSVALQASPGLLNSGSTLESSSKRVFRKRREKSTALLVSIVLTFALCHVYRMAVQVNIFVHDNFCRSDYVLFMQTCA